MEAIKTKNNGITNQTMLFFFQTLAAGSAVAYAIAYPPTIERLSFLSVPISFYALALVLAIITMEIAFLKPTNPALIEDKKMFYMIWCAVTWIGALFIFSLCETRLAETCIFVGWLAFTSAIITLGLLFFE